MSDETGQRLGPKDIRDSLPVAREAVNRDTPELYEFGPFRLDPAERKLLRGNEVVALTPKAFDTLLLLVRNSGHLLAKDELIAMLWPNTFVEEGSLSNNIFLVRKALGEDPAYIETVPGRGYRFVGAVRQLPHAAPTGPGKPFEGTHELANQVPVDGRPGARAAAAIPANARPRWRTPAAIAAAALLMLAILAALWLRKPAPLPDRSQWVPLTKFPDSVSQPALSPDGRMLAFLRGDYTFFGPGQIYVKLLPDGEPVQLTHDNLNKMSPAFSPNGARIAYTTVLGGFHWDTWVVPTLGGAPQPWLKNASGLVWTGPHQLLFSEFKTGVHMAIVTAEESRMGERDVYVPRDEPAMAHRSYLSPDGKWVLLVEMDDDHLWEPCRVVPADGSSPGRKVGPPGGGCTSGAWSPDGKWMYLTSNAVGANHIWRQRFPNGQPEQFTSGPTEEQGIAMAPDGRSFVTAVALQNTSLWVHDAKGDRQISLEGNAADPRFTPDGKKLLYRIVRELPTQYSFYKDQGEVMVADLSSGRSEPLVRGFQALDYDISADGRQVVMATTDSAGKPRIWLAPLDRSAPPRQIPNVEGGSPRFTPTGEILFRHKEGPIARSGFVYRVRPDGTGVQKALEQPVLVVQNVSPDGHWLTAWVPLPGNGPAAQAFPLSGGTPVTIRMTSQWSLDGRSVFLSSNVTAVGRTYIVPLPPGKALPRIPAGGFLSEEEIASLPGARRIDARAVPGPSSDVYAFYRGTTQRNLYRIPIP